MDNPNSDEDGLILEKVIAQFHLKLEEVTAVYLYGRLVSLVIVSRSKQGLRSRIQLVRLGLHNCCEGLI